MRVAKINGVATRHKCIQDLERSRFIQYKYFIQSVETKSGLFAGLMIYDFENQCSACKIFGRL